MWLFSTAASLFVAAPVALTATWQVPRGTKISRNILLKSIFRLFRKIYSSERKFVTLYVNVQPSWSACSTLTLHSQVPRVTQVMHVSPTMPPPTVKKESLWARPLYAIVQATSRVSFVSLTGGVQVLTSLMRTA